MYRFILPLLSLIHLPSHARGGSAGEGGVKLFLGVIGVIVVGYLITKMPAQTLKAAGGFILLVSAATFVINAISASF